MELNRNHDPNTLIFPLDALVIDPLELEVFQLNLRLQRQEILLRSI